MKVNEIHNGDCFELSKEIESNSIDLLLTDVPYGMSFQSNFRKQKYKEIANDNNLDWLPSWAEEMNRVCKDDSHAYIFCSWHCVDVFKSVLSDYFNIKNILIWEKNNTGMGDLYGDYAPKYEMIIFCSNGNKKLNNGRDANIIRAKRTGNNNHPTEKPINLMEYLINKSTQKDDLVLDTFAGGGSTLIAAKRLDRNFIGIEIDKDYCIKIKDRLDKEAQQIRLF